MTDRFEVVRSIPVPTSVSVEAQQFLAAGMALRGDADTQAVPSAGDIEAWRAVIKVANEGIAAMFEMRLANLRSSIEVMSAHLEAPRAQGVSR